MAIIQQNVEKLDLIAGHPTATRTATLTFVATALIRAFVLTVVFARKCAPTRARGFVFVFVFVAKSYGAQRNAQRMLIHSANKRRAKLQRDAHIRRSCSISHRVLKKEKCYANFTLA